ncbi:hypothetical protein ACWXWU_13550 [Shewanella sp. A14]
MNKFNYLTISAVCFCFVIGLAIAKSNSSKIRIGSYDFDIPEEYLLESSMPDWLKWLPGVDEPNKGVLFKLPAKLISENVSGYKAIDGKLVEDIRGYLVVLNSQERTRYGDKAQYNDLISGTGSYANMIVENHGQFFKVFRKVEYPYSFALVTENPTEISEPSNGFWIAHCLNRKNSISQSGEHVSCSSHAVKGDLLVEFNISEQNIMYIETVKHYLMEQVMEWKVVN